ncbi:putative ABC transporter extracellular-binding protein YckB precursor [Streptococcus parauberis]|nr:putative ABC transporter extracellular-binding protein YckB precursor [Streptococcus parauberis]
MNKKQILTSVVATMALLSLSACGNSSKESIQDQIKKDGKLVVALSPDYAPFEFKTLQNGKDTIVGSDVQLAQAIADELGVKLEISPMSFDNVLSSVQTGKAVWPFQEFLIQKSVQKFMIFQNHTILLKMQF